MLDSAAGNDAVMIFTHLSKFTVLALTFLRISTVTNMYTGDIAGSLPIN